MERISIFLQRCLAEWQPPTLLVSHDMASIERLSGRIIHVRDGGGSTLGETVCRMNRLTTKFLMRQCRDPSRGL